MTRFRGLLALFAATIALIFVIGEADARVGKGGSSGSRGSNTYSAPPSTSTAPNQAAPMQRSATQPGQPAAGRNAAPAAPASGLAGRGGLLGGLLGAGLVGMLLGYGFSGGLGSLGSIFGLLLQVGLLVAVAALIWTWWQRRQQPAPAGMPRQMYDNTPAPRSGLGTFGGAGLGGAGLGGAGPGGAGPGGAGGATAGATTPGIESGVSIDKDDYDDFERLLSEIQGAYSNEDLGALRQRATPEMVSYFAEDLADNASRGVVNKVSDVKLEQGDLAEAWRENGTDYATLAMRFGLVDKTVDRASGRVVEGSDRPTEATELWTFRRAPGGAWLLSAIQQA
jgi:predicted lipid-binding transport protein (Tim44 family)